MIELFSPASLRRIRQNVPSQSGIAKTVAQVAGYRARHTPTAWMCDYQRRVDGPPRSATAPAHQLRLGIPQESSPDRCLTTMPTRGLAARYASTTSSPTMSIPVVSHHSPVATRLYRPSDVSMVFTSASPSTGISAPSARLRLGPMALHVNHQFGAMG